MPGYIAVLTMIVLAGVVVVRVLVLKRRGIARIGVIFCLAGLLIFTWSILSFGTSFRVGIDTEHPDMLITCGAFAYSRNPIYLAMVLIFTGQFLIFSNLIMLIYLAAGAWLTHRQVQREEAYLKHHYGEEYLAYSSRGRRYL